MLTPLMMLIAVEEERKKKECIQLCKHRGFIEYQLHYGMFLVKRISVRLNDA